MNITSRLLKRLISTLFHLNSFPAKGKGLIFSGKVDLKADPQLDIGLVRDILFLLQRAAM